MNRERRSLEKKREQPLQRILTLAPWMEGTLVTTTRRCGKKNCACHHEGPKHSVAYVTWKENGKTVSLYVPKGLETEVKTWVDNYRRLKEIAREVSNIQRQIVRLREEPS